jgi:hypothetical protein
MVHARVCDPLGPRWLRSVGPALAIALITLPPILPVPGFDARFRIALSLVGVALLFARRLLRVRPRTRDASVRIEAGAVEIRNAGLLNQRVRALDVVGASTARAGTGADGGRGAVLAIVRRKSRERPLLLDFANDADIDTVRRALGLGHFGFGEIAWPAQEQRIPVQGSLVLAFAWLVIAAAAAADAPLIGLELALVVLPATVVAVLVSCLSDGRRPIVALTDAGVVTNSVISGVLRYDQVIDARADACGVVLATQAATVTIPMAKSLPEEREHLVAQILSAAARARGEGPAPPTLPASLARLAPNGETQRAWLARVDAAAASVGAAGAYRAVDLNSRDLWSSLENPDAPPRLRAAAARILARIAPDEARTRVSLVVAADRSSYARACIRVALEDDIEIAARELEDLIRRHA